MTKDVIVSVSGLQTFDNDEDSADAIEVVTPGKYYYKNGCHYVFYEEVQEGFDGVTKNRVRIRQDFMDIKKEGISNAHMVFDRNKKTLTYYDTPLGCLLLGIDAQCFDMREEEDSISLQVLYNLEIDSSPIANCTVRMHILSKNK